MSSGKSATKRTEEKKWVTVFLEVALRAIRRVHLEYGIWGAGRQWITDADRAPLINTGYGIELADERAVCAAIVQELMTSPAAAGYWREDGDLEFRIFAPDREEEYKTPSEKGYTQKVDLYIEKYEPTEPCGKGKLKVRQPPSFIEAKRAQRWTIDLGSWEKGEEAVKLEERQTTKICADIKKLHRERENRWNRKGHRKDKIYTHVLVWGTYGEDPKNGKPLSFSDHPYTFFDEIKKELRNRDTTPGKDTVLIEKPSVRWLPTKWDWDPPPDGSSGRQCPIVLRWVWVALAEVGCLKCGLSNAQLSV